MHIFAVTPQHTELIAHLADRNTVKQIKKGELLALGAVDEAKDPLHAAGLLACRLDNNVAELTWLYVDEDFRRRDCATQLVWRLLDVLVEEPEISGVTATFTRCEQTEALRELLLDVGFTEQAEPDTACYEARVSQLADIGALPVHRQGRLLPLKSVPPQSLRALNSQLREKPCAAELPIRPEDYHETSCACMEGNEIAGLLLIRKVSREEISIPWIYAKSGSSWVLPLLFNEAAPQLKKLFPPDTRLTMGTVNHASAALVERLLPNAVRNEVCAMSLDLADGLLEEGEDQ